MMSKITHRWPAIAQRFALVAIALALPCGIVLWLATRSTSGPLPQQAYVWQREWTAAVADALQQSASRLSGFAVLGAEIGWKDGVPKVTRPRVDWAAMRATGKPVGIALRIDPSPALMTDDKVRLFTDLAKSLMDEARASGVRCSELQVDFDCPSRKLATYRAWLPALRAVVKPARLVITALPSWLHEPEMARLVRETDSFVLQVHSVPVQAASGGDALFDRARAETWVAQAALLGRPFTVSLPTYSALVGYDTRGNLLGMWLDGVPPAWPAGTHVVEYAPDATEISRMIATWQQRRPARMEGVVWYRLPVGTEKRNWRWSTFAAVIAGREPVHRLQVQTDGSNPTDLRIANDGEAEENLNVTVCVHWDGRQKPVAEALRGWSVSLSEQEARFTRTGAIIPRLLPGGSRDIGWLRFDQFNPTYAEIIR